MIASDWEDPAFPLMIDAVLIMHGGPENASKWWCALWRRGGGQQRRWQPLAGTAPRCTPGTRAAARRRGGAAAAARAGRAPPAGRGRCVSIFLDKNRRHIGKSQSKRPPQKGRSGRRRTARQAPCHAASRCALESSSSTAPITCGRARDISPCDEHRDRQWLGIPYSSTRAISNVKIDEATIASD
jgi:hypothetical protein